MMGVLHRLQEIWVPAVVSRFYDGDELLTVVQSTFCALNV
jgi:hypothetical protein